MKRIIIFALLICHIAAVQAQELQARLSVVATRVSTKVDKKVFQTLQNELTNFINNRKWTNDTYTSQERIQCSFLINIDQDMGENVYKASLLVQAARPVYNTTYQSPIINFQDNDLIFRYQEFQPIEFNENRVQGSDPLAANLTAVLAYYVNIILGMDYDSFAPRGGDPYFQKAQNIVSNAPESRDIVGWKTFDGLRNRYRLAENLTDNRFALVHDAVYSYYRSGLDQFYDKEKEAREGVLTALSFLNALNQENPNTMVMQFFFLGKSNELFKLFSKGDAEVKTKARELLTKLDISNINAYKELR